MFPPGRKTLTLKLGLERTGKRFLGLLFGNSEKRNPNVFVVSKPLLQTRKEKRSVGRFFLLSGAWLPCCDLPAGAVLLNVSRAYRAGPTQHGACSCPEAFPGSGGTAS